MMPLALLKHWKLILTGLAIAALGLMLMLQKGETRHWKKRAEGEKIAHVQTVSNFRLATAEAQRLDAANKARVEAEQSAISGRITDEYESRIAAVRERYANIVRAGKTKADTGSRDNASVSDTSSATRRANDTASSDGLSTEHALVATEQAIQLIALQGWVKEQAGVE